MVRCSECGFLALRNIETRNLDEAEEEFRKLGRLSQYSRSHPVKDFNTPFFKDEELTRYVHEDLPICFAGIYDLGTLCTQATTATSTYSKDILTVITSERKCKPFTKWQQGFTPKEHREMIDRERERKWHSIELAVFVVITLIAGIGGAIVGALIARGII